MSIVEGFSCILASMYYVPGNIITVILMLAMLSISWIDALSDGLLVVAQRKDPEYGAEDL